MNVQENLCELIAFVGDNYLDEFADIDYVQTFSLLRQRYAELTEEQLVRRLTYSSD